MSKPASASPSPSTAAPAVVASAPPPVAAAVVPSLAPVKPAPTMVRGTGASPQQDDSSSSEAARMAFLRLGETEDTPIAAAEAVKVDAVPGVKAEDEDETGVLPVYEDPETAGADEPGNGGGSEQAFTPPVWIDKVDPEFRDEATQFAQGLFERSQKSRKAASTATAERDAAVKERDEVKARLAAIDQAPPAVAVPELVLHDVHSLADVEALVAAAPKGLQAKALWWHQCADALKAIEKDGEFTFNKQTFTEADLPAIQAEQAKAGAEYQELQDRLAAAPARRAYLEKLGTARQQAEKTFPDLFRPDSAMGKAFKRELSASPSLAASPKHHLLIGDHLTMEMVRAGKARIVPVDPKTAKPAKAAAPGAPDTGKGAAPLPRTGGDAELQEAKALKAKADAGDPAAKEAIRLAFLRAA